MRILLVNPSSHATRLTHLPLGLCYLKAYLKSHGIASKVMDATTFSDEEVADMLRREKPDILGVTCFTNTRFSSFQIAEQAKQILGKDVRVVFGGSHATHLSEQILRHYPAVDYTVLGEGEETFLELVKAISGGGDVSQVKGIAYRAPDGSVATTGQRLFIKDLDTIPFPDYDDLDVLKYGGSHDFAGDNPMFSVIASRSCAYECIFCSTKEFWGRLRIRSAPNVVQEVKWLCERYGAKYFIFEDDAFSLKKAWAIDVCERLLSNNLKITWAAQTRSDHFSKEVATMMKRAGCLRVCFGVESGSPRILKTLNKHQRVDDVVQAFAICREVGLDAMMSLIVGTPGENQESLDETKDMLRRVNPNTMAVNILRVYPSTAIFRTAKEQGLMDESIFLSEAADLRYTGAMSEKELYRAEKDLYLYYYLKLNGLRGAFRLARFVLASVRDNPVGLKNGLKTLFSR